MLFKGSKGVISGAALLVEIGNSRDRYATADASVSPVTAESGIPRDPHLGTRLMPRHLGC